MFDLTEPGDERPARRHRMSILLVLMFAVALVLGGAILVLASSKSTPAAAAPLPTRTFSEATVAAPLTGDVIPPSTGPVPGAVDNSVPPGSSASARPSGAPTTSTGWAFDGANRIFVKSLGINAPWINEGANKDGLVIPSDVHTVGRWTGGADIDATSGTVLMAGHVNYVGQGNGALYRLSQIQPGAVVVVTDAAGARTSWRVSGLQVVQKAALPTSIFNNSGPRHLVLITCGGPLLKVSDGHGGTFNTYRDNVIVTADPA